MFGKASAVKRTAYSGECIQACSVACRWMTPKEASSCLVAGNLVKSNRKNIWPQKNKTSIYG